MAKIEIIKEGYKDTPILTEIVEVRVWGMVGSEDQPFYIGSGVNYQANRSLWLEILYTVEGAQIFYTRNFLQYDLHSGLTAAQRETELDDLVQKGEGTFGYGDMLPDTKLHLTLEKFSYKDLDGVEKPSIHCTLKISTDTSAVFGRSGPADRSVDIVFPFIEQEDGVRFIRELIHEIDAVYQNKHPDPAAYPAGSSEWPFIWQLNQRAYDKISTHYREKYFQNPLLVDAFDNWLAQIPAGGHVLDAGCGHGDPVIGRLLEKGLQVTGSDFSPEMLRRASQQFPRANFIQTATPMIADNEKFDGICSFNSLLYLDPIDFLNSIYRLRNALKPGGLLFLYAFDSGPDWRGQPLGHRVGQWMWSWHYGMEEAASLLEEHGYFRVLETGKVQVDEKEGERIAQELEEEKREEEEYRLKQESNPTAFRFPFPKKHIERSPYTYFVVAQRNEHSVGL
jgi:SAM-dependent methyltransferase